MPAGEGDRIAEEFLKLQPADPTGQPVQGMLTVMIEAVRAIFTPRTAAQRCTSGRTPAGNRRHLLKFYDARHQDLLEGDVFPPAPPEGKRERWWVAKMTLHCGGDRVVFTLVKLRWVAQHFTTQAVRIFWDGLGREGCCRCKFECRLAKSPCVCRIDAEAHPHGRGCCQAGLLNKQLEGARRTPKTYQAVSIHEIMEIRTLVGGLYKLGPVGLEMPDFLGFCASHGYRMSLLSNWQSTCRSGRSSAL